VLGLTRADADAEDWRHRLKQAYRRLALLYHPDKNPSDPEAAAARFLEVSAAYKVGDCIIRIQLTRELETARDQPSNLSSENPVSSLCFFKFQLVPLRRGAVG
jgi:hypothetical protein